MRLGTFGVEEAPMKWQSSPWRSQPILCYHDDRPARLLTLDQFQNAIGPYGARCCISLLLPETLASAVGDTARDQFSVQ